MPHSTFPGGGCSTEEQQQRQLDTQQQPHQPEEQPQAAEVQQQPQPPQPLSHLGSPTPSSYSSSSSTSSPSTSSTSSPVLRPSSPATSTLIPTTPTTPTIPTTPTTPSTTTPPPTAVAMTAFAPLSSSHTHQSPFFKLSTFPSPTTKRSLPSKHMRSKSTNTPAPHPFGTLPPSFSTSRHHAAPPLLRSSSLPPVGSFAELSATSRFTLTNCPPSPISPRTRVPRSNSPTRQWAYSQSPRSSTYHSGSSFGIAHSPPPPPPPSYLVNEPYVASSSSGSSTPTSVRSRSPSISSLETIPDSPDAEAEALEAEAEMKKAAAAAVVVVVEEEGAGRRGGRRTTATAADKRKRWSVCGGEKRGDLELETIWEDGADALGISVGDGMGRGEMI
ncbi:hypothetical protein DFP73DRAFT_184707 [Morchella snyderi]|nr:hypothetical protein DFP73DRAFT_184707 [Morchella snyderi]